MMEQQHRPRKSLGQNFLRSASAADAIVAAIEPAEGDLVLEIGPGEGVLTERLARSGFPVTAIEIDSRLAARLRRRFADAITIVEADALKAPLPEQTYRAVGNLPYNVGTPILRRIAADRNCSRAVFMLQKEVADRLTSPPHGEDYGFLTLAVAIDRDVRQILTLPPGAFFPAPKVRSAVVVLDLAERNLQTGREDLVRMMSAGFMMRRKKLTNGLDGVFGIDRAGWQELLAETGLDSNTRAEELSLEQFDRLGSAAIRKQRSGSLE